MTSGPIKVFAAVFGILLLAPHIALPGGQAHHLGAITAFRASKAVGYNFEYFSISPENELEYISITVSPAAQCSILRGAANLPQQQHLTNETLYLDFGLPQTTATLPPEAIYDSHATARITIVPVAANTDKAGGSYQILSGYYRADRPFRMARDLSGATVISVAVLAQVKEKLLPHIAKSETAIFVEALAIYEMQQSPDSLWLAAAALASGSTSLQIAALGILTGRDESRSFKAALPLIASPSPALAQAALGYIGSSCPDAQSKTAAIFLLQELLESGSPYFSQEDISEVFARLSGCNQIK